jgi:hypothetical protein
MNLEHNRRNPPNNKMIEELAALVNTSPPDVLYFDARRLPANIDGDFDSCAIEAAFRSLGNHLAEAPLKQHRSSSAVRKRT